jgi:glycosyltransferase involved in cell wall biosynthesis
MPAVSVLMPCYNAAATVAEALHSLENQTFDDFEAVLVDDGSTDGTGDILKAWAEKDRRFRPVYRSHKGIVAALNTGLQACRSSVVARMDSDDISHSQRLQHQVAFLQKQSDVAVCGCLVSAFSTGGVRQGFQVYLEWMNSLVTCEDIYREMFVESPLAHPSVIFRRGWVEAVGGYQERGWPEDYDLWLRLYLAGARFAKVPEVLLEWREDPARLTRTDSRYSLENFLRAKAYYLVRGPLQDRDGLIIWGAGMMGRRLSRQLELQGAQPVVFVDVDPRKIGHIRRGSPIIPPGELLDWWNRFENPVLLAAVGARGARALIRQQLQGIGLIEGQDWWGAA